MLGRLLQQLCLVSSPCGRRVSVQATVFGLLQSLAPLVTAERQAVRSAARVSPAIHLEFTSFKGRRHRILELLDMAAYVSFGSRVSFVRIMSPTHLNGAFIIAASMSEASASRCSGRDPSMGYS